MRILIFSTFPILDRHQYKKWFLSELLKKKYIQPENIVLAYGKTGIRDYLQEMRKTGFEEGVKKILGMGAKKSGGSLKNNIPGNLSRMAQSNSISIKKFKKLKSKYAINFVKEFLPDIIINLGGQYIPLEILQIPPGGVLSGHYGDLPELRGSDVVRWALYLKKPIVVSHMLLAPEMDMGDVVLKSHVEVSPMDSYSEIFKKCQFKNAEGLLKVLDQIINNELIKSPQKKEEGSLFYRMGDYFKSKIKIYA